MKQVPKRVFGRTGHMSSVALFGGAGLKNASQDEADRTLDVLLEYGVNHLDVAPRYGDAELRVGAWMPEHRKSFFLATKTGQRTYKEARDEFHRSLERLQVGQVDLIQMHALYHPDEWDIAMGDGGVLEFLIEAKEPYNYVFMQTERYANDFESVMRVCQQRNVAVQTIKSIARGPWATTPKNRATWYQPLEEQSDIDRAVHWVMGRDGIHFNTAGDMDLLPMILDAASRYETRSSDVEMLEMLEGTQMTSVFGIGT
jgi:aryl-alcohol dehydrogenase-like predicted oxidoreductase